MFCKLQRDVMNNNSRNHNRNNCRQISEITETPGIAATNESTEIDIEANSSQKLQNKNLSTEFPQSTNIDMEFEDTNNGETSNEMSDRLGRSSATSSVQRNLLTLFSDARQQFVRPHIHAYTLLEHNSAAADPSGPEQGDQLNGNNTGGGLTPRQGQHIRRHHHAPTQPTPSSPTHSRNIRSWRMNLNNVLSFSSAPSTEAIRSLISNSGTFRYTPLSINSDVGDNINVMLAQEPEPENGRPRLVVENTLNRDGIFSRAESSNDTSTENNVNQATSTTNSSGDTSISVQQENGSSTLFTNRTTQQSTATAPAPANNRNTFQDDEDNNVISDMFIKFLSHFVRYLPFICILFVKFIHDHLLGILDLLLLHGIMYQVNKSLREQVAKFSQKSYGILLRDFSLIICVVAYRFLLASSTPDPFGLLITPPSAGVTLELARGSEVTTDTKDKLAVVLSNYLGNVKAVKDEQLGAAAVTTASLENTVTITKAISLGVLLYYVAVNDLVLKLLTILIKIAITLMPTKIIRHKPRVNIQNILQNLVNTKDGYMHVYLFF